MYSVVNATILPRLFKYHMQHVVSLLVEVIPTTGISGRADVAIESTPLNRVCVCVCVSAHGEGGELDWVLKLLVLVKLNGYSSIDADFRLSVHVGCGVLVSGPALH